MKKEAAFPESNLLRVCHVFFNLLLSPAHYSGHHRES